MSKTKNETAPVKEQATISEAAAVGGEALEVKPGEYLSIVAGNRVLFQGHGAESVTVKMRGE